MRKKWILKNRKTDVETLTKELGYSKAFCTLLGNRGLDRIASIRQFLDPAEVLYHDPVLMADLPEAVHEILDSVRMKKKIRVLGDYDVDGVCSTYLLVQGIRACGGDVDYVIPDRVSDGYGINENMVRKAFEAGVELIVTCDNGISAHEALGLAMELGMTTIVTDHHQVPFTEEGMDLPPADWIVNPKRWDCPYPFKGLCGAGVAFKLVQYLFSKSGVPMEKHKDFPVITALATVCDVVDLLEENRGFVQEGLKGISQNPNLGLNALRRACGLEGKTPTAYEFGFVIGPCLNAAGRLTHAKSALALLFSTEEKEAADLAAELRALNEERKEQTAQGVRRALEMAEREYGEDRVLVLQDEDLHESIAGIVAGRVREARHRPTLILTRGETAIKGSGRSIEGYDLFQEMIRFKDLYLGFGGHPMAVGLSLPEDRVSVLRKNLNDHFPLSEDDLIPVLNLDLFLPLRFAQEQLISEVSLMEPFGKANPAPVFADKEVLFTGGRIVGKEANVLLLNIRDHLGYDYKGILFQYSDEFDAYMEEKFGKGAMDALLGVQPVSYSMDIAYQPQINEYQSRRSVQLILKDYR